MSDRVSVSEGRGTGDPARRIDPVMAIDSAVEACALYAQRQAENGRPQDLDYYVKKAGAAMVALAHARAAFIASMPTVHKGADPRA